MKGLPGIRAITTEILDLNQSSRYHRYEKKKKIMETTNCVGNSSCALWFCFGSLLVKVEGRGESLVKLLACWSGNRDRICCMQRIFLVECHSLFAFFLSISLSESVYSRSAKMAVAVMMISRFLVYLCNEARYWVHRNLRLVILVPDSCTSRTST